MVNEQRIRAYYKRYRNGHAAGYYTGNITGTIYEEIARKFKMPIRQVREILGRPAREPGQYGCVAHKGSVSCSGKVAHIPDPFASEIMNDHTPYWLCERHAHMSAMDI